MPQLIVGQRTFLVENYFKTRSINEVIRLFKESFPDRDPPSPSTVLRNVNKYRNRVEIVEIQEEERRGDLSVWWKMRITDYGLRITNCG